MVSLRWRQSQWRSLLVLFPLMVQLALGHAREHEHRGHGVRDEDTKQKYPCSSARDTDINQVPPRDDDRCLSRFTHPLDARWKLRPRLYFRRSEKGRVGNQVLSIKETSIGETSVEGTSAQGSIPKTPGRDFQSSTFAWCLISFHPHTQSTQLSRLGKSGTCRIPPVGTPNSLRMPHKTSRKGDPVSAVLRSIGRHFLDL